MAAVHNIFNNKNQNKKVLMIANQ